MLYFLLCIVAVTAPIVMYVLRRRRYSYLFDLFATLAFLLANISAGLSVLDIKLHRTEFTTHVHEIFMDPLFLGGFGYIGLYAVYRLMAATTSTWQQYGRPPSDAETTEKAETRTRRPQPTI